MARNISLAFVHRTIVWLAWANMFGSNGVLLNSNVCLLHSDCAGAGFCARRVCKDSYNREIYFRNVTPIEVNWNGQEYLTRVCA
mmetsp:Transcript_20470/g.56552  ORF Transcript_20470/g.56552 Transcript_20470/m.56552 type:complete len:84 (-) Transcript_20470:29-280(-)